ncbi:MAG: hypothetical protein E5Y06_15170 [Mesorhizobium sp.]|nr:MAG: hypothetical protein E5Y06_15170 [Mesorhizobium sp.]TJU96686.1 MAG: hypothetical protein E5Y08_19960 [Mesorhizobium sp.]TJV18711.1 MAG: hypothetical protein E5Y07_06390 [Mesorhizobium sp.]
MSHFSWNCSRLRRVALRPSWSSGIFRKTVPLFRLRALSPCFGAIPKGKRYELFPGKPFHTFPGIALIC